MAWKNELDRTVHESLRRAVDDKHPDLTRAIALANDLVALAPHRAPSHFALGMLEELMAGRTVVPAPAPTPAAGEADGEATVPGSPDLSSLVPSAEEDARRWRWLGRLDTAARMGRSERVLELSAEPTMDEAAARGVEGRVALRAVSRALLGSGHDARAYDLYLRHLAVAGDDAAKKDADGLVGDAVRRADDQIADGDEAGAYEALARALEFTQKAGLDGRAGAKIERKLGRSHQLAGRWEDASTAYRSALGRLDPEDRYRFVLHGDLALASLAVRGTLDLLPVEGRPGGAEAEAVLGSAGGDGEGESYNAIYTLGVLAYERGDWATAATRFREADRLMRETRAKARIVHARARFFLGACLLRQGATGEALAEAESYILRDAQAAALDASVKQPIFDLLALASPGGRLPGRMADSRGERHSEGRGPGRSDDRSERRPEDRPEGMAAAPGEAPPEGMEGPPRRERGRRGGRGRGEGRGGEGRGGGRGDGRAPAAERMDRYSGARDDRRPGLPPPAAASPAAMPGASGSAPVGSAAAHLAEARRVLDNDPHQALRSVDEAFKSRPTFEDWYAAYRIRLEALIRLQEQAEALRTYERFRAKLHERGRADRLEEMLLDASGPMAEVLEPHAHQAELVDLYESMPGRDRQFVDACVALASRHAEASSPTELRKAVSLLREAIARGGDEARARWEDVAAKARAAGVSIEGPAPDDVRALLLTMSPGARVLVVGGDESSRAHGERVAELGRRAGFLGSLVLGGARPSQRALAEVEEAVRDGVTAIVLLHTATPDLKEGVRRLAGALSLPVREIPYAGAASLEAELLTELGTLS